MSSVASSKLEPFVRHGTDDKDTAKLQDRIERIVQQVQNVPFLKGILLEEVTLVNSVANRVTHLLGRTPVGCWLVKGTAGYQATMTAADEKKMTISCGAAQTATLWVF